MVPPVGPLSRDVTNEHQPSLSVPTPLSRLGNWLCWPGGPEGSTLPLLNKDSSDTVPVEKPPLFIDCPCDNDLLTQRPRKQQKSSPALVLLWPGRPPPHPTPPHLLYLFQAELELSCRAWRVAWNRGRSLSTGELMKRGLGLRKEPILWTSTGRLGAKPRVISPGEGTASPLAQRVPTAHGKGCSQSGCLRDLGFS